MLAVIYLPALLSVFIFALAGLGTLVWLLLCKKGSRLLPALLTVALLAAPLFAGIHYNATQKPLQKLNGTQYPVTARVTQTTPTYGGDVFTLTLQVLSFEDAPEEKYPSRFIVQINTAYEAQPGDLLRLTLRFSSFAPAARNQAFARGQYIAASVKGVFVFAGRSPTFITALRQLQYAAGNNLTQRLPLRLSSVAASAALGDQRFLTPQIRQDFRLSGLSHILIVSGFHVGLIASFPALFPSLRRRRQKTLTVITIGFVLAFLAFSGFTPSLLRSGISQLLILSGVFAKRRADVFTSLAFSSILLCMQNPYAVADIGLLLSYSATLGTVLGMRLAATLLKRMPVYGGNCWLIQWLLKAAKVLIQSAIAAVCVAFSTLPILLLFGLGVSAVSPLVNIMVLPLSNIIMVSSFLAALPALPVLGFIASFFSFVAGTALVLLEKVVHWAASLPFGLLYPQPALTAAILLVFVLAIFAFKSRRFAAYALSAVLLLTLGGVADTLLGRDVVTLSIAGGSANPALVITKNGQSAVLFRDRRTSYTIDAILKQQNVKECSLLIDLRAKPQDLSYLPAYPPRQIVYARQDITAQKVYSPFAGVNIYLQKQDKGVIAVVEVEGYKVGITSGYTNFSASPALDILVAGQSEAVGRFGILLCGGNVPTWAGQAQNIYFSLGQASVSIRPGTSILFKEVQYGTI